MHHRKMHSIPRHMLWGCKAFTAGQNIIPEQWHVKMLRIEGQNQGRRLYIPPPCAYARLMWQAAAGVPQKLPPESVNTRVKPLMYQCSQALCDAYASAQSHKQESQLKKLVRRGHTDAALLFTAGTIFSRGDLRGRHRASEQARHGEITFLGVKEPAPC